LSSDLLIELSGSTVFLDACFNMRSLQVNREFTMLEDPLSGNSLYQIIQLRSIQAMPCRKMST